jgi:hypothetical protein
MSELTRRRSRAAQEFSLSTRPEGPTAGSVRFAAWVAERSVREAALAIGCTEGSIRNWTRARTLPGIGAARRIEEVAGIPILAWVAPLTQPDSTPHEEAP